MLVNLMRYLIFRPYWSVPIDITQREVLPGIAKDPNYLAEHDFEIVDHRKKPVDYTPKLDKPLLHGELMVRQDAGAGQLARAGEVHVPQPVLDLSALDAGGGAVHPDAARLQPRVRAGGEAAGAGGMGPARPRRSGRRTRSTKR